MGMPLFKEPPESLCILKLSAIGDTCHIVPLLHRLRRAWPTTRITWIIGKVEHGLMSVLPDIEFIVVNKRSSSDERRQLRQKLAGRRFDVLLHLQLALRASFIARQIRARVKLGFDFARARELQWLFTTHRIAPRKKQHVLDGLVGFIDALGIPEVDLDFSFPLPATAHDYARTLVGDGEPTLIVSPCSSHPVRNWRAERYAAVIAHAQNVLGLKVILCGGPGEIERNMGEAIESALAAAGGAPLVNQIGRSTLPQLLALLGRARVLISPDSGPAHMGTLAGLPVVGLYASTNSRRGGPYRSLEWCVDRYDAAARLYRGKPAAQLPWTTKIRNPGVMDLIEVGDVIERLEKLRASGLI
jgi:heptosyltransferase I